MNKIDKNKKLIKISALVIGVFALSLGATYAYITQVLSGTKKTIITSGNLELTLEEGDNINISDAFPIADEVGMLGDPFTFKLVNKTENDTNYVIKLVDITSGTNKLALSDVKYGLEKDKNKKIDLLSNLNDGAIDSGMIFGNQTINYTLRFWLNENVIDEEVFYGKSLSYKIKIEASQDIEIAGYPIFGSDNSKANPPVMVDGLIPVVYNETANSWIKADVTQTKYYNYDKQMWANAVTVKEENRNTYMNAKVGTAIPMSDINTMWVWIPRYEYMYTNLGNQYAGGTQNEPGEIKINFLEGAADTPSDSNNYKVHPSFNFSNEKLSGFWMAKFETTGELDTNCTNTNCDTSKVTILPSNQALTNQNVSSYFYMARSMQLNNPSTFGFNTTDSDVHMSKNRDWGSVAYLSQSKYGKYGNPNYSGVDKEVAINNCSSRITGIGGDSVSAPVSNSSCTDNTYETDKGQSASTTGNITGIYDMSGGVYDYVMGNYNNVVLQSGFSSMPDPKYYDYYAVSDPTTGCDGGFCYGHVLPETSGWYGDTSSFVALSTPWVVHSSIYNATTRAGIFYSDVSYGDANPNSSARLVITPIM